MISTRCTLHIRMPTGIFDHVASFQISFPLQSDSGAGGQRNPSFFVLSILGKVLGVLPSMMRVVNVVSAMVVPQSTSQQRINGVKKIRSNCVRRVVYVNR